MPSVPARTAPAPDHPAHRRCPWCGAATLRTKVRTPVLPGDLDECRTCRHVFRTPDPTAPAPPPADPDRALRRHRDHLGAARALLPFGEPESWLDVGTGPADFPAAARAVHPYTAFDGLDTAPELALAGDRLDEAHHGTLPDLAPRLAARYDVVSLFRHLERVPDPRTELRAALRVLRPGGHLLIEGTDPRCRAAALGRWWAPYHRPGPLHLIPEANLHRALRVLGATLVLVDHRGALRPAGAGTAAALLLTARRGPGARPATAPLRLGRVLDRALRPPGPVAGRASAYRLIARRDPA
ncbi:class I SAM-dependent methyltransferase [Streptomyces sp. NPDC002490]|uniref:class I SAM-dependent methyltransferase n=1 Tax=Streptomyces sp. NPDC002490 TaxID=3154416 RepID=UPI003322E8A7